MVLCRSVRPQTPRAAWRQHLCSLGWQRSRPRAGRSPSFSHHPFSICSLCGTTPISTLKPRRTRSQYTTFPMRWLSPPYLRAIWSCRRIRVRIPPKGPSDPVKPQLAWRRGQDIPPNPPTTPNCSQVRKRKPPESVCERRAAPESGRPAERRRSGLGPRASLPSEYIKQQIWMKAIGRIFARRSSWKLPAA